MVRGGALEGRALRARRSGQLKRQWARCDRVWGGGGVRSVGVSGGRGGENATVCERSSRTKLRRREQRSQSAHRTGCVAGGRGSFSQTASFFSVGSGEDGTGGERGQRTELTSRALRVVEASGQRDGRGE